MTRAVGTGEVRDVVVLGGGSAGWLAAGVLAAGLRSAIRITLVEAPDVPAIGVGEGTWPTMRETLRRLGVSESDFLADCDAAFKQGSKFIGWRSGDPDEYYYHPFSLPQGCFEIDPVLAWQVLAPERSYSTAMCPQEAVCERQLAPKQAATPEFAAVTNYAYHLDAVKFGHFLRRHCTTRLGVTHVSDHVVGVERDAAGDILSVLTRGRGALRGDLFIDCSGSNSVLLGGQLGVGLRSRRNVLFNDRALAVQVPHAAADAPLASVTRSTALSAGWVWDIGLPTRRGMGYVYSSAHCNEAQAEEEFRQFLRRSAPGVDVDALSLRALRFDPGHREVFWDRNCVAIGMAAGFIEPLEASALALVELSAAALRDDFPVHRDVMGAVARRFNERFHYRWDRIVDFLKLHYVLSQRDDSDYWRDHRAAASIPERLQELLQLWRYRAPARHDLLHAEEVFPIASYQYVLCGMGFRPDCPAAARAGLDLREARSHLEANVNRTRQLLRGLPSNRELLATLASRRPVAVAAEPSVGR